MPTPVRLQLRNRAWLVNERLKAGLTQEELADRAEISHSIISKLEQGKRERVDPQTARNICAALSVDVTHLFRVPEPVAS